MTAITWVLLLGGVLLNAVAQLLLKAATRTSGVLISDGGQVSRSAAALLLGAPPLWLGLILLWGECHPVARRAVARARQHCLPDALGRLHRERARGGISVRRSTDERQDSGIALIIGGVVLLARAAP